MSVKESLGQESVVTMNSYLEVDVARWLSVNEIPYAYEPFTVPSVLSGKGRRIWDMMVDILNDVGQGDFNSFDDKQDIAQESGINLPFATMRAAEVQDVWIDIREKHRLAMEIEDPSFERGALGQFNKQFVLPDMVTYMDVNETEKPLEWEGWGDYNHIIEVGGLWGVGIPDNADSNWWEWYRVAGVAFKEMAYRMLGMWDDVIFVVPFQPPIESLEANATPPELRDDDNYVIFDSTQAELELGELYDRLGLSRDDLENPESRLSPLITPTKYDRDRHGGTMEPIEYDYDGISVGETDSISNAYPIAEDTIVFHSGLGEVYITPEGVQVTESQWRGTNMIMLKEHVLDVLRKLSEEGIIVGLGVSQ